MADSKAPAQFKIRPAYSQEFDWDAAAAKGQGGFVRTPALEKRVSRNGLLHHFKARLIEILAPKATRLHRSETRRQQAVEREDIRSALKVVDDGLSHVLGALTSGKTIEPAAVGERCTQVAEALFPIASRLEKASVERAQAREGRGSIQGSSPSFSAITSDLCGTPLRRQLPQLGTDPLKKAHAALASMSKVQLEDPVLRQLHFSVSAELLRRLTDGFKDTGGSGRYDLERMSKDQLVELRRHANTIDRLVRPDTPDETTLPGASFTWAQISHLDARAESLLDTMLLTEDALKQVAEATSRGIEKCGLKVLRPLLDALDHLGRVRANLQDQTYPQLRNRVRDRIVLLEQKKTEAVIGPADMFSARRLPHAKLMELNGKLVNMGDLTRELDTAMGDVQIAIVNRKMDAEYDFQHVLKQAVRQSNTAQATDALFASLAAAQAAVATFQALDDDLSMAHISRWIEEALLPQAQPKAKGKTQATQRAAMGGGSAVDKAGLERLHHSLTVGDGRAVLNLLSGIPTAASKFTVAYLNALENTLSRMQHGNWTRPTARARGEPQLTKEARTALQTRLKVRFQPGSNAVQSIGNVSAGIKTSIENVRVVPKAS